MRNLRIFGGIVLASIGAFCLSVVPIGAQGQMSASQKKVAAKPPVVSKGTASGMSKDKAPVVSKGTASGMSKDKAPVVSKDAESGMSKDKAPAHSKFESPELQKLNAILANQQRLIDRLGNLEDKGLPNQLFSLQYFLVDTIRASTAELIQVIGGLEQQCSTPDILPLPEPGWTPPYSYCRFDDTGRLRVQVYNQGGTAAGAFVTRVTFAGSPVIVSEQPIAGLAAFNGSTDLFFDIPPSCYPNTGGDTQCNFAIGVDVANGVYESDEVNNNVAGVCIRIG